MLTFCVVSALDDLACMREFYTSTNGKKWTNSLNWDTEDVCQFYGIICDEGKRVTSLVLKKNGLTGALPPCLADTKLTRLNLQLNDFTSASFDTAFISQLTEELNLDGCGFAATEASFVSPKKLVLRGNDFSNATVTFGKDFEFARFVTYMDLTGSQLKGKLALEMFAELTDLSAADTNLVVTADSVREALQVLDLSRTESALDLDILVQTLILQKNVAILGLRGTRTTGLQPPSNMTQKFRVFDVDDNPLLCKHDTKAAADCVFIQLVGMEENEAEKTISFQITTSQRVKSFANNSAVFTHLDAWAKDYAKSNENTTVVYPLKKCSAAWAHDYIYFVTCEHVAGIKSVKDIAITYNNKQVSTGALMICKEIDDMLKEIAPAQNYSVTRNYKQSQKTNTEFTPRMPIKQTKPKLNITVTAYSLCPDFIGGTSSFQDEVMSKFDQKYFDISKYVKYSYQAMAKREPRNVASGSSIHGQMEAHFDLLLMCFQKYQQREFKSYVGCYPYGHDQCIAQAIPDKDVVADIELCAVGAEGQKLLGEAEKWISTHKAGWSPSIYFGEELLCQWGQQDEKVNCEKYFSDVDAFAHVICARKEMEGVEECKKVE